MILVWDRTTDVRVTSFNLFVGDAPRHYTNVVSVTTNAAVECVSWGVASYFAVSAVTSDGLVSDLSSEVRYVAPPKVEGPKRRKVDVAL